MTTLYRLEFVYCESVSAALALDHASELEFRYPLLSLQRPCPRATLTRYSQSYC